MLVNSLYHHHKKVHNQYLGTMSFAFYMWLLHPDFTVLKNNQQKPNQNPTTQICRSYTDKNCTLNHNLNGNFQKQIVMNSLSYKTLLQKNDAFLFSFSCRRVCHVALWAVWFGKRSIVPKSFSFTYGLHCSDLVKVDIPMVIPFRPGQAWHSTFPVGKIPI